MSQELQQYQGAMKQIQAGLANEQPTPATAPAPDMVDATALAHGIG